MEHFSRLLPLKDSGQEFTRSNQVNVSSGSNVVPQREGGERCWHGAQKRIRGCRAGVATALGRASLRSKWSRARDTRFRDFRSEASRARDAVRGSCLGFSTLFFAEIFRRNFLDFLGKSCSFESLIFLIPMDG